MAICDGCGNSVLIPNKVLGHTLCLKCAMTLKVSAWKNKDFETNEEVISMKSDVIFSASRAGMSGNVIQTVADYFDSQIEEGLVYKFYGGEDQILKVYEDYCQIITLEDFDEDEMSKKYARSMKKGVSLESIFSDGAAVKSLAMGLISKKSLVKTGMSLASSVVLNSAIDHYFPGNADVLATPGIKTINYIDCEDIKLMKHNTDREECIGAIKFLLNSSKEYNFFYSYNNSSAKNVCTTINELVGQIKAEQQANERTKSNLVGASTVADEILKFKELLDVGAITQEEFDAKKKQLLNL